MGQFLQGLSTNNINKNIKTEIEFKLLELRDYYGASHKKTVKLSKLINGQVVEEINMRYKTQNVVGWTLVDNAYPNLVMIDKGLHILGLVIENENLYTIFDGTADQIRFFNGSPIRFWQDKTLDGAIALVINEIGGNWEMK